LIARRRLIPADTVRASVRNPFRLKNLNRRFLPAFCVALAGLALADPSPGSLALGSCGVVLGLALRSWGAGHLVKRDQLTRTGPYVHLRHPLYAGTFLIGAGFGVAMGPVGWGLLAGTGLWFALIYFPAKERRESELLEQCHGFAYVSYRARVPALVPDFTSRLRPHSGGEGWRFAHYSENNELGTVLGVVAVAAVLALRAASL